MAGAQRNVEFKARCGAPEAVAEAAEALGAESHGTLEQVDTYFAARHGRLKLREQAGSGAELIAYSRADERRARESSYRIVAVADAVGLKAALGEMLGIEAVVRKRRRLYIWSGVRIHIDDVDGLGSFVELEGVAAPGSDLTAEAARVGELRRQLGIAGEDILAVSYCDLLATPRAGGPAVP